MVVKGRPPIQYCVHTSFVALIVVSTNLKSQLLLGARAWKNHAIAAARTYSATAEERGEAHLANLSRLAHQHCYKKV